VVVPIGRCMNGLVVRRSITAVPRPTSASVMRSGATMNDDVIVRSRGQRDRPLRQRYHCVPAVYLTLMLLLLLLLINLSLRLDNDVVD